MNLYLKPLNAFCFFMLISSMVQSQNVPDSVFCYLEKKGKQNDVSAISMRLYMHNASTDSVFISDFSKSICNISAVNFRKTQKRIFYWDLKTLANKEPDNAVIVTILAPPAKMLDNLVEEQNATIVIPPQGTFISDVYMLHSPFIIYPNGYYQLCLFDSATNKCIAKTVIEIMRKQSNLKVGRTKYL